MDKEEFCRRFKAHMLACAGTTFPDGTSVAEYADDIAPTYWDNPDQREEGPEECSDADISYWEEE